MKMLIGIISDTHDKIENVKYAADFFEKEKVEIVIHCGDWTKMSSVLEIENIFENKSIKVIGVLGNNDEDVFKFLKFGQFKYLDLNIDKVREEVFDNLIVCINHGDNKTVLNQLINSKKYQIVFTGHTHKKRYEYIDNVLVINPGSLAFSIPRIKETKHVFSIFNTKNKNIRFLEF